MKFLLSWLEDYLPGPPLDAKTAAERLTSAGFIVEGIERDGTVLEVEITANRPDGMNHRGLAREAAVALSLRFEDAETRAPLEEGGPPAGTLATVTIEEPALCSRYSARVLEGIRVASSPARVLARFAALDLGPISAPVDATNHVLWDIGQPLHAFDLEKLAKGKDGRPAIVVRRARAGETLVTLDGVTRALTPDHLVIADAEKPVGLAGVMGGLDTAISESTTRVLLEAAHFAPGIVRRTARSLGMHTDASHRFERGTDPEATREGLDRAARMIVAACGGTVAKGAIHVVAREIPRKKLALRSARRDAFLGMKLEDARCKQILSALGFAPVEAPGRLDVTVPSFRIDVEAEIDLVEEVIRCVGYDQLPETLPKLHEPALSAPRYGFEDRVRDVLTGFGLVEAQTYSFISESENAPFESIAPGDPVRLENPLGEPFTTLRATPLAGLLKSAQHNVRRGLDRVALFEVGRTFGWKSGTVAESPRVALVLSGSREEHWSAVSAPVGFFDGSGAVAGLVVGLGASDPTFSRADVPFLAPGRAAWVRLGDVTLGFVGVLHASLAAAHDLVDPVVADLDLAALFDAMPAPPVCVELPSRFPGSDVDVTVSHRVGVPFQELEAAVTAGAPAELVSVGVKYRYQGPGVPDGFVKTTLHLRFGSAERSLSREEINAWRDAAAGRLLDRPDTSVDGT